MTPHVFFIHSVSSLTGTFDDLCREHLPEARLTHIADESLIQRALEAGGLTTQIIRRLCEHVTAAQDAGAAVIQVTCSSLSPGVAVAERLVHVPVLTVDEPVARLLVRRFDRIGVIATASSTLRPSTELVRRMARQSKRDVAVQSVYCRGAYDAFFAGDLAEHDRIVLEHLRRLVRRVDAVLLAQVSMARLVERLTPAEKRVPILTSPLPAVRHLSRLVRRLTSGESHA